MIEYNVEQRTNDVFHIVRTFQVSKFLFVFNSLPQVFSVVPSYLTLGIIPKNWYDLSEERFSKETWWAPHNLWRQPFHGLVTVLLYLLLQRFSHLSHLEIIGVCFLYGLIKEIWEFLADKKYQRPDRKDAFKKSLSDVIFYALIPAIVGRIL